MFSLTYCGYCNMARTVLDHFGCNYKYVQVDKVKGIKEEQLYKLNEMAGINSYPKIFIGTESIGGYTDLLMLNKNKKLKEVLERNNVTCQNIK